tara:strand:+ start:296 stop:475 length:180 start_codon:yes stop_codon:yes gene_type:complete
MAHINKGFDALLVDMTPFILSTLTAYIDFAKIKGFCRGRAGATGGGYVSIHVETHRSGK